MTKEEWLKERQAVFDKHFERYRQESKLHEALKKNNRESRGRGDEVPVGFKGLICVRGCGGAGGVPRF